MKEFLHMGGYAFYVWTSYGLTLVVLAINVIIPIQHEHAILKTLARKLNRRKHDNVKPNP